MTTPATSATAFESCPECGAEPGAPCRILANPFGGGQRARERTGSVARRPHNGRYRAARVTAERAETQAEAARLCAWLTEYADLFAPPGP